MNWREYKRWTLDVLKNRKARTAVELETRTGNRIARGTLVEIVDKHKGLTIRVPTCEHCGQSVTISKVSPFNVDLIDEPST